MSLSNCIGLIHQRKGILPDCKAGLEGLLIVSIEVCANTVLKPMNLKHYSYFHYKEYQEHMTAQNTKRFNAMSCHVQKKSNIPSFQQSNSSWSNNNGAHEGVIVMPGARCYPKIYIQSAPNNSNKTDTFMCLGRTGCFWLH